MEVASEHIDRIFSELRRLTSEVSRLNALVRPARTRYRPNELAERLSCSRRQVYKLWDSHKLAYRTDDRGRYSTEQDVLLYEADK